MDNASLSVCSDPGCLSTGYNVENISPSRCGTTSRQSSEIKSRPKQPSQRTLSRGGLHKDPHERLLREEMPEGRPVSPEVDSRDRISAFPTSSNHQTGRPTSWFQQRKTYLLILILFLLALLCSVSHFIFFDQLHETVTEGSSSKIRQSHVTTVSLLLVTIFKSTLLGSVSLSFAQYLWDILRQRAVSLAAIETIFSIRSNPFELLHPRAMSLSPVLFFTAVYMWLLPVAVIYPPSALTVAAKVNQFIQTVSVPTFNFPDDFNATRRKDETFIFSSVAMIPDASHSNITYETYQWLTEWTGKGSAPFYALPKQVLYRASIIDMPAPHGLNSSHTLTFIAPQLSCQTQEVNTFDQYSTNYSDVSLNDGYISPKIGSDIKFNVSTILGIDCPVSFPETFDPEPYLAVRKSITSCKERHMMYFLNVTFVEGKQFLNYTMQDIESQPNITVLTYQKDDARAAERTRSQIYPFWSSFALLDTTLRMVFMPRALKIPLSDLQCLGEFKADNGTTMNISAISWPDGFSSGTPIDDAKYSSKRWGYGSRSISGNFTTIINEDNLNELLTNITLSTLSLNLWQASIPMTMFRYQNVYQFARPLNLIIPYALCLTLGLTTVLLGLRSLRKNKVPVADGGFLQIMMATRGNTTMEALVVQQGWVAPDQVSKELQDLKVRFGELSKAERMPTQITKEMYGFGTVHETITLG